MKKYCCEDFQWRHSADATMGLNIRIIKVDASMVFDTKELKYPYRIFLTEGYEKGQSGVKNSPIKFCPYCGEKLANIYNTDEFINEEDTTFLSI